MGVNRTSSTGFLPECLARALVLLDFFGNYLLDWVPHPQSHRFARGFHSLA
jgi:hypothetical protein